MASRIPSSAYDIAGPPGAPAIVFVHGLGVTRRMWELQMAALADNFRVVALDLPGHGAQVGTPFRMAVAIDQIAALADEQGGGRAVVAGLSLGGYIAMEFGFRCPEKAAGLILAGCTHDPVGPLTVPYRAGVWLMEVLPESWLSWIKARFYSMMYRDARAELLIAPGFYSRAGARALGEVIGTAYLPKLRAFSGPVLFLNGSRDVVFRLGERKFLAAARQGRLQIIERAFHISNLDRPEAFSQAVREFVNALGWSRSGRALRSPSQ